MISSFYTNEELLGLGIKAFGNNVLISRFARFYNPEELIIGSNVRIDDFCIFSGKIKLGSNIHISAYTALYGKFGIEMEDYTGLSPRCTVFSASDDFSGNYLIGPMNNPQFTNVKGGKVMIKKYSQLGCNCAVLPAVTIAEGVVTGAMSLIINNLDTGIPAKYLKDRSKKLLDYL